MTLALLVVLAACDDEKAPTCPPGTPGPTLANVWPHEDGRAWTYKLALTAYRDTTAVPQPPGQTTLPSFAALHAALSRDLDGPGLETAEAIYGLAFAGEVVTASGITAQHLVETLVFPDSMTAGENRPAVPLETLVGWERARPRGIAAAAPPGPAATAGGDGGDGGAPADRGVPADFMPVPSPLLLGGYAFADEDTGYYGYGDLDRNHSWIYLEGDVAVGTTFSLQLAPLVVDGVWLQGRVWAHRSLSVGGERFCNAVEVMYVIDLGESGVTDEAGHTLGVYRSYVFGVVIYAPEAGPVYARERTRAHVRTAYDPNGRVLLHADQVFTLTGRVLPD